MRTSRLVRSTTRGMLRSTIVAVAVVIAAAAVSVKLLLPDPGTQQRSTGPVHLPATPAGDAEAIAEAPTPRKAPVQTFKVFASRDPFEPLIEDSSTTSAAEGTTAAKDTGTGTSDEAQTAAAVDDETEADDMALDTNASEGEASIEKEDGQKSSPNSSGGAEERTGGSDQVPIRLVAIRQRREALVRVHGRLHRPSQGETFANNFQILSIRDDCASLLFGDEQFILCKGQEILK